MLNSYTREHVGRLSLAAPITIDRMASLRDAASAMFESNVSLLLVDDADQRHAGVITERDITRAIASGADPDHTIVGFAMTGNLIMAEAADTLLDVAVQMIDADIRHIVVAEDGEVVGILSMRDLMPPVLLQALGLRPSDED